ncbi:FSR family fosmidomycin resistance protein-like MFS transporter [Paraburkholderia unamae]|uniref:FSR family fosmidomycin resistance protein-like MFS transporter n=2 Tax=Paraburkholderia unamae TaxID=219649 RepID=A0ABX5KHR2_9BURK|nr:FSR family fosmidomycin resistance protein-like MFS transporter [Paraburkholderia unamae]
MRQVISVSLNWAANFTLFHAMKIAPTPVHSIDRSKPASEVRHETAFGILGVTSASHLLNDMIQSLMIAVYPVFKVGLHLSYWQIGFVTLAYQLTASLLQPLIGRFTDRRPQPYSLPLAMIFSFCGLFALSAARGFFALIGAAMLVGVGSSVFHPETSRVARLASGGRHGLAQSIFQVGGNAGSAIGPLLAALVVVPNGQGSIAWFTIAALLAMILLWHVSWWYDDQLAQRKLRKAKANVPPIDARVVAPVVGILVVLMFSKYFYTVSISNYLTFYLTEKFGISVRAAQLHLFVFLGAVALGTLIGGPLGDRLGRKTVIWFSILGAAPFTIALPYANLAVTTILITLIGLIVSSAFSAILVYAQELMPGRVGMVSGLFFGFAFGLGGIGAATLGWMADHFGITAVYTLCAWLPVLGFVAVFLPKQATAVESSQDRR